MADDSSLGPVELAAELTAAWLSNPNTRSTTEEAVAFLTSIHAAVAELGKVAAVEPKPAAPAESEHIPAVSVRKSLANPNFIISMLDGRQYKSLTRHLSSRGISPAQYREMFGLKADYPLVAPAYSEQRREMAKKLGLGRKSGQKAPARKSAAK